MLRAKDVDCATQEVDSYGNRFINFAPKSFLSGYLAPHFRVISRPSKCNISHSISQKAKQERFKCDIPRS